MSGVLRYPASTASLATLLFLTAVFSWTGALAPENLPADAGSSLQITGMALMLILLPTYIVAALFVMPRRSLDLVDQLRPELPAGHADSAVAAIRGALKATWPFGLALGLALSLLNTNPIYAFTRSATRAIDVSLSFGQIVLWSEIGLILGVRLQTARAFSRLGELVRFDLFHLDRLKPLARSGLIDVVMIALGLALTPLQSLDAEFRWYNYRNGLIVMLPAAALLMLWPLLTVHRRIRAEKQQRVARVDALLRDMPEATAREEVLELETLLAHRERLRQQRTWPLSTGLLSRLFLYLIIPPLAWAGAAVVELFVDRLIMSQP